MALMKSVTLFRRTRTLEKEIDDFLDKLSETALVFKHAVQLYLAEGATDVFDERLRYANELESGADDLRRISGVHSDRIEELLGHDYGDEAVHRNNLVLV